MTFIETLTEDAVGGDAAALYEADRDSFGYVRNHTKVFSLAPEVCLAWQGLVGSIRQRMDPRRYELVTIAAARRIRSSYCMLAHGSVLLDLDVEPDAVRAIAIDHHRSDLEPVDVAVMDLADKVASEASSVTEADIERLRELGLADSEIFDVVAAAAARCFFSKTLDGLGVQPDARYRELDPALSEALVVGRPIATE